MIYKDRGFSLIELSIVLIIIGLLVAGVTGGASLISSARNRAFINELLQQKQNIYIFKAKTDRYPGDINNVGKFGNNSGYQLGDFSSLYSAAGTTYIGPNSAVYWDLYLEGISDFKPSGEGTACVSYPCSKVYPAISYNVTYFTNPSTESNNYLYKFRNNNQALYIASHDHLGTTGNPKIARNIDNKIDDGVYNTGIFRSFCYPSGGYATYDNATSCRYFYYDLGIR